MMHYLRAILLGITLLAVPDVASAQTCSASYSTLNFGTVDLTTGAGYPTSATQSISCTGTSGQVVYVCGGAAIGGPYAMGAVSFSLFQDAGGSIAWTGSGSLTIGGNGTASLNQTVYGRLAGGQQQVAPGSYQTGGAAIAMASYGLTPVCGTAMPAPVPAQVVYPPSCRISAQNMTFTPNGLLTTTTDASSTISATCSNSTPYDVQLSIGTAAGPTQRKLTNAGYEITYGLYQDAARSVPWGNVVGVNSMSGSGTGGAQSLQVYGRIPVQSTPPPGTYLDQITVVFTN